jgi:hypothetical protein
MVPQLSTDRVGQHGLEVVDERVEPGPLDGGGA